MFNIHSHKSNDVATSMKPLQWSLLLSLQRGAKINQPKHHNRHRQKAPKIARSNIQAQKINILSNSVFVLSKRCLIYGFIEKALYERDDGALRSERDRIKLEKQLSKFSFFLYTIYFVLFIVESLFFFTALNIFLLCRKSFSRALFLLTFFPPFFPQPTQHSIADPMWLGVREGEREK